MRIILLITLAGAVAARAADIQSVRAADPRNFHNGLRIPAESYADQPYVVITRDGNWLCTITTGKGEEGQQGQHIVATISADKRVTTALLDNSGDLDHNALVNVRAPVGIIYGEDGMARPNAEGDYNNAGNKGPCWLGMMAKGGHGSGPWDGAAANVAWMRWHIGGENSRKAAFLGTGGDYNNSGIWTTKSKNWDGWKNWNE